MFNQTDVGLEVWFLAAVGFPIRFSLEQRWFQRVLTKREYFDNTRQWDDWDSYKKAMPMDATASSTTCKKLFSKDLLRNNIST
ncbi:MAG: hypothetical protein HY820_06220 [Acidobacteria bacterium]|nr:hypothetical protein [Acidobacteriota bacterium]